MAKRSAWNTFRRRVAPVLLLMALALVFGRRCDSEAASVSIRVDPGAEIESLSSLHVSVYRGDATTPVAYFDANYGGPGPRRKWPMDLLAGSYRLEIRAEMRDGTTRRFHRQVEVRDQAAITVNIARELGSAPAARDTR